MRVKENFHLYENVDADFIQARLDRYPVALIVQVDADFLSLGKVSKVLQMIHLYYYEFMVK